MYRRLCSLLCALLILSASAFAYDVNFPADATITNGNRSTTAVNVGVAGLPMQSLPVPQADDRLLYHDFTAETFVIPAASQVTLTFGFTADWMNGYVYVDLDGDGIFEPETELLSYSHLNGKDSAGNATDGSVVNPPSFSLPASVAPGRYAMRFKVDWNSADPAGNNSDDNSIIANGGSIVDATLVVVEPGASINVESNNCTAQISEADNGNRIIDVSVYADCVYEGTRLTTGYSLDGYKLVNPQLARHSNVYIAGENENSLEIPASDIMGNSVAYVSALRVVDIPAEGDYVVEYATLLPNGAKPDVTVNGKALTFENNGSGYYRASELVDVLVNGTAEVKFAGKAGSNVRFYLDSNQDGAFFSMPEALTNEHAVTTANGDEFSATLNVPALPGVYRARVEVVDGCTADFFINVHRGEVKLIPMAMNGRLMKGDDTLLPEVIPFGKGVRLKAYATLPGFATDKVIIRHGQNLNGPELIKGNPQWADLELRFTQTGNVVIPADAVNGDVAVYVLFEEQAESEWTKVWGDEFNSGTMDTQRWGYHPRYGATWNRLIAKTVRGRKAVNNFSGGCYNSYARTTTLADEESDFITGAICSEGKFSIKYGKIEARIKTTPHIGNFPAFWMMPAYSELRDLGLNGWPQDGEIDIWEQVNDQQKAHHTVHSGWTGWRDYLQGAGAPPSGPWPEPVVKSPANSGSNDIDASAWHVFALEWDAEALRWYVDGNLKFTYANQHYIEEGSQYYIDKVTWPFSKEFYIILNQSVGQANGWAKGPDKDFVYHTHFDYVRVYQKKGENGFTSRIDHNGDDPDFFVPAEGLPDIESSVESIGIEEMQDGPAMIFDINGRRVAGAVFPGIYIEKRGNYARKIIVK